MTIGTKVSAGQDVQLSATLINRLMDLLSTDQLQWVPQVGPPAGGDSIGTVTYATNNTAGNLSPFAVAAITGVEVTEGTDSNQFKFSPILQVGTPTEGAPFAICLEDIGVGYLGRIATRGYVPVQVNISDATHDWARLGTSTTELVSSETGPARILYREGSTGTVWCIVALNHLDLKTLEDYDATKSQFLLHPENEAIKWADIEDVDVYGLTGFWARLTSYSGGSGYGWTKLESDATTATATTGTGATEVNGNVSIYTGSSDGAIVWLRRAGDTSGYRFSYEQHGFWGQIAAIASGATYSVTLLKGDGTTSRGMNVTATDLGGDVNIAIGTKVRLFTDSSAPTAWRFLYHPDLMRPVTLVKDGGLAGDKTTQCSYTYAVTDLLDSTAYAAGQTPVAAARPPQGAMVVATHGVAYRNSSGNYILYSCNEAIDTNACS